MLPFSLRILPPPSALFRVAVNSHPWDFADVADSEEATVTAYPTPEEALLEVLRSYRGVILRQSFDAAGRRQDPLLRHRKRAATLGSFYDDVALLDEAWRYPDLFIGQAYVDGFFADFREPQSVRAFRDELEYDAELWPVLSRDWGLNDLITPLIKRILLRTSLDDRPCAGFVERRANAGEVWNVFLTAPISVASSERLASESPEAYVQLAQLALTIGASTPIRPSADTARQLLAEALTSDAYHELAEQVDVDDVHE